MCSVAMKGVILSFVLFASYTALSFSLPVDKLPCDANRFLTIDRIREAMYQYPEFNKPFICQLSIASIENNRRHPRYHKCVKKLMDKYLELKHGGLFNPKNYKEMNTKLNDNIEFAKGLKKCSKKLSDCYDINNLHHCIVAWAEP